MIIDISRPRERCWCWLCSPAGYDVLSLYLRLARTADAGAAIRNLERKRTSRANGGHHKQRFADASLLSLSGRIDLSESDLTRILSLAADFARNFGQRLLHIALGGTNTTDRVLREVAMIAPTHLDVNRTRITSDGCSQFAYWSRRGLRSLNISCNDFDAMVVLPHIIPRHPRISNLDLSGTANLAPAIQLLGRLTQLRRLRLNDTSIAAEELIEHLRPLHRLRALAVIGTPAGSSAGVAAIRRALPWIEELSGDLGSFDEHDYEF